MRARSSNVLGEDLVRLSDDDFRSACDKGRNTSDAIAARLLPIRIDGMFESAVLEYRPRFLHGQPHRLRDLQKHSLFGEVTAFDKISFVESVMDLLEPRLGIGPFRELLRQPAVIRVRAPVIRKMFGIHQCFHARVHGVQIEAAACKEILQRKTLGRRLRMKRKVDPLHIDGVIPF